MRDALRRAAVAAVALVAAASLAACTGLPTSGGVTSRDIDRDADSQVLLGADGPRAGATQEQILAGFLDAGVSPANQYGVARQFLTPDFADRWNPSASVSIRTDAQQATRTGENALQLSYASSSYLDDDGRLVQDSSGVQQMLDVQFELVDDEWRIANAADGLLLSASQFANAYADYRLYFFDPALATLVPDVRWLPQRANAATAGVLVGELVEGPDGYLGEGAVVSAFPAGTQSGAVTIESGTATVALSGAAGEADDAARTRMLQQVAASLADLGVTAVGLTIGGAEVVPPTAVALPRDDGDVGEASDPIVLQDGVFGAATADGVEPIAGVSEGVAALQPDAIAWAEPLGAAAVRAASGAWLVREDAAPVLVDGRAGLAAPTIDTAGAGGVWTAAAVDPATITVTSFDGAVSQLRTGLPAGTLQRMELSHDGTRLLVALGTDTGPRLLVLGVVRTDGVPTALTSEYLELRVSDAVVDATWRGGGAIATIERTVDGETVWTHVLGAEAESLGAASGAVRIAAVTAAGSLRVLVGGGQRRDLPAAHEHAQVSALRAASWQDTGITARVLATQR